MVGDRGDHCALMPAARITRPHFSVVDDELDAYAAWANRLVNVTKTGTLPADLAPGFEMRPVPRENIYTRAL